jgi:hypothetical protein
MDMLAKLDARIAFHEAEAAKLRAARETAVMLTDMLGGDVLPADPARVGPGKPEPRPARREPGEESPTNQRRAAEAARLLLDGPKTTAELAGLLGVKDAVTWLALNARPGWFQKTDGSRLAKWELTEAGRLAASADTAQP